MTIFGIISAAINLAIRFWFIWIWAIAAWMASRWTAAHWGGRWSEFAAVTGPSLVLIAIFALYMLRWTGKGTVIICGIAQGIWAIDSLFEDVARARAVAIPGDAWGVARELNLVTWLGVAIGLLVAGLALWAGLSGPGALQMQITTLWRRIRGLEKYEAAGSEEYGSARWATRTEALVWQREAEARGGSPSLTVGRTLPPGDIEDVTFDGSGHILTLAGSGGGKTRGSVIPALLAWSSGVVVLDPKGEVHAVTSRYRKSIGQVVAKIDPDDPKSDTVNLLEVLRKGDAENISRSQVISSALVERGSGSDSYWADSARQWIQWALLYLAEDPQVANLRELHKILSMPAGDLQKLFALTADESKLAARGISDPHIRSAISRLAGTYAQLADRTFSGIHSHVAAALGWLANPSLARVICGNGQKPLRLQDAVDGKVSLYICLPPVVYTSAPAFARVLIGTMINACYSRDKSRRLLLLLDEAARLGEMLAPDNIIGTALTLARGFSVTIWLILQDAGQIKAISGDDGWKSMNSNCEVRQFFAIQDEETANWLSRSIGSMTVAARGYTEGDGSGGNSTSGFSGPNSNRGASTALIQRPLIMADEIIRLDPAQMILLRRSQRPALVAKPYYDQHPVFRTRADRNPFVR